MGASEELKRFENDLRENPELMEKLDEAAKRIADAGEAKTDNDVLVKAAAELGYSFTAADIERKLAEAQELDLDEMEAAAGGNDEYDHEIACVTLWHCHMITMHTETKDRQVNCWDNYVCFNVNNCRYSYDRPSVK